MSKTGWIVVRRALVAGVVMGAAGAAQAGLSQVILEVHAEVNGVTGTYQVQQSSGTWIGQQFVWQLQQPAPIVSSTGQTLGFLQNAAVYVVQDPVIAVNFNIASTALNTSFTISSPLLSFPAIGSAVGAASAAVSVTDLGGDGATLTPNGPGAYNAHYNGLVPGGTTFADLLGAPVVAGAFATSNASQDFPGGGAFVPIAGAVSDMSARWDFTLSPNDIASGTGVFTVVPAPSAIGVLALGGLMAGRRRR